MKRIYVLMAKRGRVRRTGLVELRNGMRFALIYTVRVIVIHFVTNCPNIWRGLTTNYSNSLRCPQAAHHVNSNPVVSASRSTSSIKSSQSVWVIGPEALIVANPSAIAIRIPRSQTLPACLISLSFAPTPILILASAKSMCSNSLVAFKISLSLQPASVLWLNIARNWPIALDIFRLGESPLSNFSLGVWLSTTWIQPPGFMSLDNLEVAWTARSKVPVFDRTARWWTKSKVPAQSLGHSVLMSCMCHSMYSGLDTLFSKGAISVPKNVAESGSARSERICVRNNPSAVPESRIRR